ATAAAAQTGISLTARGHASMLILATGSDHHADGIAALDWGLLARAEATLVFYMPVQGLEAITMALTAMGRDGRERALVVEGAGASPTLVPELPRLATRGGIEHRARPFRRTDARGATLVIAATGLAAVDDAAAGAARRHGALVNAVDRPASCDFIYGSVLRR